MTRLLLCFALVAGAGCRTAMNYTGTFGPRYAGAPAAPVVTAVGVETLRLVTFNIQFARRVDSAIALFAADPSLRNADIIALQEMDAPGTRMIAAALGMYYVYYPATVHPATGRDFGNAILSRWPLTDDRKIILPHLGRFEKTQRIATAATVSVDGVAVRVYSVHLGTMVEQGPGGRRDQLRVVLEDAADHERVIVSGDLNSRGVGALARAAGYDWPTEHNPHTEHFWSFDHVFLKGLSATGVPATGVVRNNRHASDHRPVWVLASLADR